MTTPDANRNEDVLKRVREILASARSDQVQRLLRDIRTAPLFNKDMADTLH